MNRLYCRTLIRSRPMRPLWWSTFKTRTSTRSPGPSARLRRRWLTGSLSGVMLLLWMSPEWPTPISTKAPNRAVLSTRPVKTVPTRRSLIDTMPCLKSACPKSEDGRERKKRVNDVMPPLLRTGVLICMCDGCWCLSSLFKGDFLYDASTGSLYNRQRKATRRSKGYRSHEKHILDVIWQPNTCVSILLLFSAFYFTPLSTRSVQGEIIFPFVALIQTRKVCTPGKSPDQLSSQQHWFQAVASAHLFTQLSSDKEAGCSALQPNRANLKMNLDGMFPNFEKRAPTLYPLFVSPH